MNSIKLELHVGSLEDAFTVSESRMITERSRVTMLVDGFRAIAKKFRDRQGGLTKREWWTFVEAMSVIETELLCCDLGLTHLLESTYQCERVDPDCELVYEMLCLVGLDALAGQYHDRCRRQGHEFDGAGAVDGRTFVSEEEVDKQLRLLATASAAPSGAPWKETIDHAVGVLVAMKKGQEGESSRRL